MKKLLLIASLWACGDTNDSGVVIDAGISHVDAGDAGEEPNLPPEEVDKTTFWPAGYGWRVNDEQRCYNATPGCKRPRDKSFRYKFHASTCSAWYQARVVAANTKHINKLTPLGWSITGPGSGDTRDVDIRCSSVCVHNPPLTGVFNETDLAANGTNFTFSKGNIYLCTNRIEAVSGWSTATDAQRKIFVENVAYHELMHSTGLGHWGPGASVMDANVPLNATVLDIDSDEVSMLTAFAP